MFTKYKVDMFSKYYKCGVEVIFVVLFAGVPSCSVISLSAPNMWSRLGLFYFHLDVVS